MAFPSGDRSTGNYLTLPSYGRSGETYAPAKSPPDNGCAVPGDIYINDALVNENPEDPAVDRERDSLLDLEVSFSYPRSMVTHMLWIWVLLTIVCIMVAINHWAGVVFLTPVLIAGFVRAKRSSPSIDVPSPKDLKKIRLWSYKTGKRFMNPHSQELLLRLALVYALMSFFGLTGLYVMKHKLWGENWGDGWIPDGRDKELGPRKALWLWLFLMAFLGSAVLSLTIAAFTILKLYIIYEKFKPPQPAKSAPQVPTITDFPPPVVDCALPFTILSFSVPFVITDDLNPSKALIGASAAGIALSVIWFGYQLIRKDSYVSRIQLCIDWATEVDHVPVEPHVKGLLAYRKKIRDKYTLSLIFFLILIMVPILMSSEVSKINRWILAFVAVVYFVLLYLGLWAIWRRLKDSSQDERDDDDDDD